MAVVSRGLTRRQPSNCAEPDHNTDRRCKNKALAQCNVATINKTLHGRNKPQQQRCSGHDQHGVHGRHGHNKSPLLRRSMFNRKLHTENQHGQRSGAWPCNEWLSYGKRQQAADNHGANHHQAAQRSRCPARQRCPKHSAQAGVLGIKHSGCQSARQGIGCQCAGPWLWRLRLLHHRQRR